MDWRSKAACLTVDPEPVLPHRETTGPAISQVAEAKASAANASSRASA